MIGETDIAPTVARVGGTEINYCLICPAKLWLFSHGIEMERTSDKVDLGRLLHEETYRDARHKELMIDNLLCIDFDESGGIIHEVKMSNAFERAHKYQLLYYLYYLKQKGINGLTGVLNYPKSRRIEEVILTPAAEEEIQEILAEVRTIKQSEECPHRDYSAKCKKCSYEDYCWG